MTWDNPQYDQGTGILYVTPEQFAGLKESAAKAAVANPPTVASQSLGIPLVELKAGEPVRLSTGKLLVYSAATKDVYLVDDSAFKF